MSRLANKRILVTGGAGFIGSHLTRQLVNLGAEVAVTVKYNSVIDNARIVDLWDKVHVIEADLRNLDSLKQIADYKPQIVFHLAAYNHVGDSFLHINEALDANIKGTANVMQTWEGYERFVYIATSEVYGYQTGFPFTETMTPNPISPYSVGKYGGEQYARLFMEQRGMPIVILRPFNAFGPYQSARAVIPELIQLCLEGRPVKTTQGKQTREFNFVTNLTEGMALAGEADGAIGQTINIGSGEEIAIRDLVKKIHALTGSSSELQIGALPDRPTEIWRMAADNRRAKEILGWEPQVDFETGLLRTIEWFQAFVHAYRNTDSELWKLATWR
ncbi:NAD-dependent epimerase/dehydratase family protein [Magnetofaba australis]|uniref:Putative nucleoside-diphosphate-sugar epimerase n=1 Tax=Magnetofaba australis IT-1 TaxID=1434232 RepID=A0A1Y2KA89_9PROT|nr:GDP-mannose 4,6-dehydratase [Magnetofaba australis]OSM06834.1 putative nucleoside-diphosphate-sugar epimerase [Magnetofaba australis IT-1]